MEQKYDNITGFISGIFGGIAYINFANITWETAWESIGHLLWLGFIALFTGAMGVAGKHLITKWFKRKTK